ncbi:uncharacterized protein LOC123522943 isoform X2 [Mercenaria mercenaria]|uniref:uncharacterized protein LOC123522943 isoform X2 n=1 Tax=Mercenaria mercenaria TaxID=6596 RepID=UPI00234E7970|nr:uncharacterized protein LOC123522943 isoform X2 [Mercenaria mercenaria]
MEQLIQTMRRIIWIYLLISVVPDTVNGQGRLLSPPGRSSLWRFGYGTPVNYNDNALTCGGVQHKWEVNNGKCGVCGDPWDSQPRDNEAGGQYAMDIISGVYKSGTMIEVIADVANANGGGYFEFRLCANNNFTSPVKEECLNKGLLTLEDGVSTRFENIHTGLNRVILKLPEGLTCDQCVLQWKYRAADQYGCDSSTGTEKKCGFGRGEFQTEYFACADIAIYIDASEQIDFPVSNQSPYAILDSTEQTQNATSINGRSKRAVVNIPYERAAGIRYVPAFPSGMQLQIEPNSLREFPKQSQIQWSWTAKGAGNSLSPGGRSRRRTHNSQVPNGISIANRHLNGIISSPLNGGGRVRSSFNQRQHNPTHINAAPLNSIVVPEPAAMETSQAQVRAIFRTPVQRVPAAKPSVSVKTVSNRQPVSRVLSLPKPQYNRKNKFPAHRNFLDPFVKKVSTQTQMVLSRSNYKPTKRCQHCPFDQCLDGKLRIDHLFPGLFDSPSQFFECKRFERVFTLGNYDVVQDGLPSCQHPRFKRQLKTFEDDDIGCCATRPQVILPLTVEAENDTFSVVQLGDAKKQFIVQGICGKGNTRSCTVCAAENNFQWVLVYDPRVKTNPPVSFVPVKFPHYCRCYNYMTLKG